MIRKLFTTTSEESITIIPAKVGNNNDCATVKFLQSVIAKAKMLLLITTPLTVICMDKLKRRAGDGTFPH